MPKDRDFGLLYALGSDRFVYWLRPGDGALLLLNRPQLAEFQAIHPGVITFDPETEWQYYEQYLPEDRTPLPRGIMATGWARHSFIDHTGRIDTYANADNRYGRVHPLSRCTWVLFPNRDTVTRGAGPELKVTAPDGREFWPDDLAYYPGQNTWADLDDEDW